MTEGLQSAELNARRRFAAFISYAHADAATASKLQARLERYRLPKHLAIAHTDGNAALGQIFRDREDLAAAPSLSDAIRAAIAEAEALIVICSPDAVASRWVGEEIALFRSLHPDRPILAAVVRGDPGEAFPPALTEGGNEPLAADLRKEADGPSLGFLKIVAGIAGVPLDALVQRDAQRRIRRVMWITGSAIAAMLVMGIMTTLALSARNEAARQRAEAEGLVEYMLTDLREKLKGVGRLDVMEGVNTRALKYYGGESVAGHLLKARTLHALGEDEIQRDQVELAEAKFAQASRTTQKALRKSPDNPDVIFAHGQSEYWLGYIGYIRKDWKSAEKHWHSYHILSSRLQRQNPGNVKFLREDGYAKGNICTLSLHRTDIVFADISTCAAALETTQAVARILPENNQVLIDVANRHSWLADALEHQNDANASLNHRHKHAEIAQQLVNKNPENRDYLDFWLTAQISLARAYRATGNGAKLSTIVVAASRKADELSKSDPQNKVWSKRKVQLQRLMLMGGRND